jgi:DNA-binding winged helix-turn-helix (wHTH) protein/TolB-like protein/tetratricopeptide (TPR) repeat protein
MTERPADEGRFLIGDLVLDVGQRSVSRNGKQLDLPRLSFRLLHELALGAPNVLTQDELIERVWPGRVISPETLTQRIKLVRQAIGDDAQDPRYIGLVRGEGYRLLAAVHALPDADQRPLRLFLGEVGRRNILPIAAVYATAAWALSRGFHALGDVLPASSSGWPILLAIVLTAGFPIVVWRAWRRGEIAGPVKPWSDSVEGRLTAGGALVMLAASTAGLAALMFPAGEAPVNDVAILPFENAGADASDDYLSYGIPDQLRNQLSSSSGLRIVARASSDSLADEGLAPTEIAETLGVDKVVAGAIDNLGGISIINVELIEASTGTRIWSHDYTMEPGGLLGVQQQIFDDVSGLLVPRPGTGEPATNLPTNDEKAYSLLLRADRYYREVLDQPVINRDQLHAAIDHYRLAIDEDPGSPMLHSRLAAALLFDGQLAAAEASITRAIDLDTENRSSHVQHTLGLYLHARHENGVGAHYARAVALNPNNVEARADYGLHLWTQADIAGARENLERAVEIDPRSLVRYEQLGNFYGVAGFGDAAEDLARRIDENFKSAEAFLVIARIHELTGDLDEAIAWALRARDRDPALDAANWKLAELYARLDDVNTARRYDPGPSVPILYFSRQYEDMIDLIVSEGDFENYSSQMVFALATAFAATDRYDSAVLLLTEYGLPGYLLTDSITTSEIEASINLADALQQSGRADEARRIADPLIALFNLYADRQTDSWHPYINLACLYSIKGDEDRALEMLERMSRKRGLPWYPRVRDAPCFRKALGDDPRYHVVLDSIVERRRQLRERLPATLERFGLTDIANTRPDRG